MSTGDDKWLRALLQSAPAEKTAACLDAERLAAWTDGALSAAEQTEVELHLSGCGHCMAAVAALQRTAPPLTPAERVFAPSRLLRWLVPITAVATAVVIWIVVPGRQLTVQETPSASRAVLPEAAPELAAPPPRPQQEAAQQQPARQQRSFEDQRQAAGDAYAPVPEAGNQALERPSARADSASLRDEVRRRGEADEQAKAETADLAREAPQAAAPAAPPPAAEAAARSATSTQLGAVREESADTSFRSTAKMAFAPGASISPTDPSALWRVATAGASIERSTDGGQTWAPTARVPGMSSPGSPALTMKAVRAVDARRAVATTSDGRQFYTTDSGASWTLVQENQTAPF